jgi:hypothetical protein
VGAGREGKKGAVRLGGEEGQHANRLERVAPWGTIELGRGMSTFFMVRYSGASYYLSVHAFRRRHSCATGRASGLARGRRFGFGAGCAGRGGRGTARVRPKFVPPYIRT